LKSETFQVLKNKNFLSSNKRGYLMQLQEQNLRKKGWSEEEIEHAREILVRAEEKKHPKKILLEKALYWVMLLIIVIGTIIGAWVIEPILLVTNTGQAVVAVVVFGLLFGSLATILFRDIEELQIHHHIISSLIIPLTAIITSIILTKQAARITAAISLEAIHNPLLLGIAYSIGALLPYLIFITVKRKEHAVN